MNQQNSSWKLQTVSGFCFFLNFNQTHKQSLNSMDKYNYILRQFLSFARMHLGGNIRLYSDKFKSQPVVAIREENPLPVQYISFSGADSSLAQFYYNCSHINTDIKPNSGWIKPPIKPSNRIKPNMSIGEMANIFFIVTYTRNENHTISYSHCMDVNEVKMNANKYSQ